jgi:hypothetical protein
MSKFEAQRKAASLAIRAIRHDLVKAKETQNQEWIEECEFIITNLQDAIETLKTVEAMANLFGGAK